MLRVFAIIALAVLSTSASAARVDSPIALPSMAVPLASAFVQAKTNTKINNGFTTVAVTLDSAVTAGNLLVCAYAGSDNAPSIASSPSNTFVKAVEYTGGIPNLTIWTVKSAASGSTTVTVTIAGFEFGAVSCQEISGHDNTSDYDKAPAIGTGFGPTATSGSTGTLTQANEMAVCFVHHNTSAAVTPSGSFTEPSGGENNANRTLETSYLSVSSTSALTCGGTWSGDATWRAGIITFKDGAGGGGGPTIQAGAVNNPIRGGGWLWR